MLSLFKRDALYIFGQYSVYINMFISFLFFFHSFLLARLRTATLRHDDEGQVSLFFAKTVLQ